MLVGTVRVEVGDGSVTPPPYPLTFTPRGPYSPVMRVLGALLLLIGLALGFSPGTASASPCPSHAHHVGVVHAGDQGTGVVAAPAVSAEVVASVAPGLSLEAAPDPVTGHVVPEGQACCHAAPTLIQGVEVDPVPFARASVARLMPRDVRGGGRRSSDIFRPPAAA